MGRDKVARIQLGLYWLIFGDRSSLVSRVVVLKPTVTTMQGGCSQAYRHNNAIYIAAIFPFSIEKWKQLEKTMLKYFWSFGDGETWHAISWEKLCSPKNFGGLVLPKLSIKAKELADKRVTMVEGEKSWSKLMRQ